MICFLISFHAKDTEWNFVVNVCSRLAALLASPLIAFNRFAFLCLPIGSAAILCGTIYVHWMIWPDLMLVAARTRAVLARISGRSALGFCKSLAATKARARDLRWFRSRAHGSILTFGRAILTFTVSDCGGINGESLAAILARQVDLIGRRNEKGGLSTLVDISAFQ